MGFIRFFGRFRRRWGIWSIDLKSHWVRTVEMSRIGLIELVGGRSPFHKEYGGRSPKSATFATMRMAYGQGRVELDPEVVSKKRKVGLFGKQEHKNISRPQPWKLFQNMTKSKKNTTKNA